MLLYNLRRTPQGRFQCGNCGRDEFKGGDSRWIQHRVVTGLRWWKWPYAVRATCTNCDESSKEWCVGYEIGYNSAAVPVSGRVVPDVEGFLWALVAVAVVGAIILGLLTKDSEISLAANIADMRKDGMGEENKASSLAFWVTLKNFLDVRKRSPWLLIESRVNTLHAWTWMCTTSDSAGCRSR
jgi:hypothetical protein